MTFKDKIFLAVIALIALGFGIAIGALGGKLYSPVSGSYEIPSESWRVTTYQNKRGQVFVAIETMPKKEKKP